MDLDHLRWEFGYPRVAGDASWEFDPDEIDSVISKWEALRDDCMDDRLMIDGLLSGAVPPSEDEPSGQFVTNLLDGLRSLKESNESMLVYIQDFVEKLKAAKKGIEATEDDNADPFRAASATSEA